MSEQHLDTGSHVRVRLVKNIHPDVEYDAVVVSDDGTHVVVRGPWAEDEARDLGFVRFEPGDIFTEHYWRDRWYSIKEVRTAGGLVKGWYCDVARPVRVENRLIDSEDLELDLWVSADGRTVLRLDEDEFEASGISETDAVAATQARNALDELERLARGGFADIDVRMNASTDESPPNAVVDAFGGQWPPESLAGGEGRAWRAGEVVLKPLERSVQELIWQADLLGRVRGDGFRVSSPLRAANGSLTVNGWYATAFLVGQHEPGRWADVIRVGEAFHAAVGAEPRPAFLDQRTDPWAIGDRVAWGELPVSDFAVAKHVERLTAARRPAGRAASADPWRPDRQRPVRPWPAASDHRPLSVLATDRVRHRDRRRRCAGLGRCRYVAPLTGQAHRPLRAVPCARSDLSNGDGPDRR